MDDEADDDMSFQLPDLVQPHDMLMVPQTNKENEELMTKLDMQDIEGQEYINNKFSLELPHVIPEEKEPTTLTPQDEHMRWHQNLNHLQFKRICKMAKEGLLGKKLLTAIDPVCPTCQYGKMHHKPWRT